MISDNQVLDVVLFLAVLIPSVIFHEVSHGWVAERLGDPTARRAGRITLNPIRHVDPFGSLLFPAVLAVAGQSVWGWARPVPVEPGPLPAAHSRDGPGGRRRAGEQPGAGRWWWRGWAGWWTCGPPAGRRPWAAGCTGKGSTWASAPGRCGAGSSSPSCWSTAPWPSSTCCRSPPRREPPGPPGPPAAGPGGLQPAGSLRLHAALRAHRGVPRRPGVRGHRRGLAPAGGGVSAGLPHLVRRFFGVLGAAPARPGGAG